MDLSQIYTELILEQSRNKKYRRDLENPTHKELGHNPSCGDEITLQLRIDDEVIEDISYTGMGCAISQASTSIMCDLVKGLSTQDALDLTEKFSALVKGELEKEEDFDALGDAIIFESMQNLPARVKCAVLPWYTLRHIILKDEREGSFTL